MSDVNESMISGRMARKPELRTTPSGAMVADAVIATHQYSKTNGERTTFVRCSLWNAQAAYADKNIDVGDRVFITGQIDDDNYIPKGQEESTKGRLKLNNCRIQLLSKAQRNQEAEATPEESPSKEN